ncbi:MAG: hypothetical protein KBD27_00735 [Candidatus Moranbacteria bacterium]|nr:hypothetical protein [Candidatus Moranbacteria bacterium]
MSTKKAFLGQVIILGAFLAVPVSGVLAVESNEMGMGRGGERGGPPTVDDCVEKSGKTAEECQAMMKSLESRKPGTGPQNRVVSEPREARTMKSSETRPIRIEKRATERFTVIEARLSRVMAYLTSKGVATTELAGHVSVLKEKMVSAETAGATFETTRTAWNNDKTDANKTALENARTAYKESVASVKVYYQGTVLPLLKTLLQSVTE